MDNKPILQSKKTYIDKATESLYEKYEIEFAVESIGGLFDSKDDSTVKMYCYALEGDYQNIKFLTEVDKVSLDVSDDYMNIVKADEFSKQIISGESNYFAITSIETPVEHYESTELNPSFLDYYKSLDSVFITTFLFIKDNLDSNESKTQEILNFASKLEEYDLSDLSLIVFYVDDLDTEDIRMNYYQAENPYDYFTNEYEVNNFTGLQIRDCKLISSKNSIIENFEVQE